VDYAAIGSLGGTTSWYRTRDRSARTLPGRTAFARSFEAQARRDFPDATDAEIEVKVRYLRTIFYKRIAMKGGKASAPKRNRKEKNGVGSTSTPFNEEVVVASERPLERV